MCGVMELWQMKPLSILLPSRFFASRPPDVELFLEGVAVSKWLTPPLLFLL